MLEYILQCQENGEEPTIRDIAKKLKLSQKAVIEQLGEGFDGYDVYMSEEPDEANGDTTVTLEALDYGDEDVEDEDVEDEEVVFHSHGTYTGLDREDMEDHLPSPDEMMEVLEPDKTKRKSKSITDIPANAYLNLTQEEADAKFPDRIRMPEVGKLVLQSGIPISRLVKAFGGDKMRWEPLNEHFRPFTIDGKKTRWLPGSVVDHLDELIELGHNRPVVTVLELGQEAPPLPKKEELQDHPNGKPAGVI
jgi:hypothetical protein